LYTGKPRHSLGGLLADLDDGSVFNSDLAFRALVWVLRNLLSRRP